MTGPDPRAGKLPPLQPGEARALIDVTGASVILQSRHALSVNPEPDATITFPTDQLLLVVAQAVLQREMYKQQGSLTPNVLPGTTGPRRM